MIDRPVSALATVDPAVRHNQGSQVTDSSLSEPVSEQAVRRDHQCPMSEDQGGTPATISDASLLQAIANGSEAALGILYDRYGSLALGVAMRFVRERSAAEEVVQDSFVAVWRRAATFDCERGAPRSWLMGIVQHRAIDRLRRMRAAGRFAEVDLSLADHQLDRATVAGEVLASLGRDELAAALGRLPDEQREAIEMNFLAGLSHDEIATRTGRPLGTIKGRVRLGLQKLRGLLEPGLEHPPADLLAHAVSARQGR